MREVANAEYLLEGTQHLLLIEVVFFLGADPLRFGIAEGKYLFIGLGTGVLRNRGQLVLDSSVDFNLLRSVDVNW